MSDELLAAIPGALEDLGAGRARWTRFDGAERRELGHAEAHVLAACATFAPRDWHRARLAKLGGGDLAPVLDALHAAGLLAPPSWYVEPATATLASPPEPLLVVRSYQRPAGLRRLLRSLLADERRHGVRRRLVVVDDTYDPGWAAQTEAALREFAAASESTIGLLGPVTRDRALQPLLEGRAGQEREALLEMLDPRHPTAVTGSRTWNWAVLLAAGGTLSILDDDVTFPLRRPAAAGGAVQLVDSVECVAEFHDAPVEAGLAALDEEPYAHLRRWLGQPARAVLGAHGYDPATLLHRAADELLFLRGDARIAGVTPGLYGGIAFGSSAYVVYSNAPSQRSLWHAPYRPQRLEADNVWYGYPAPRLTSQGVYTPLLLDARELLPFAGTWGRIDDTYFLMLLRAIAGPLAFAHLPVALGHRDLEPRDRLERARQPLLIDRNAFLAHVFAGLGAQPSAADRAARLEAVGVECAALAADGAALRGRVLAFRQAMRARVIDHVEAGLAAHPEAPAAWREVARAVVEVNRRASADERIDDAEIERYRAALVQVATVAPLWALLWTRAREINAQGAWPGVVSVRG